MYCRAETLGTANFSKAFEKARLLLGLGMLLAGLYFGLFSVGAGEGLGLLTVMASPFVMLTDK
jgi:hypothetical protein